jgi:hypothetical protein
MTATPDDRYAGLSPFELKDRLVALATECTRAGTQPRSGARRPSRGAGHRRKVSRRDGGPASGRGAGYRELARSVVHERHAALYAALGIPALGGALHTDYYATIDVLRLARSMHGERAATRLARSKHPLDFVFDLAREYATVVLPGEGFDAPDWSIRISLANLPAAAYREIGGSLRVLLEHYLASSASAP